MRRIIIRFLADPSLRRRSVAALPAAAALGVLTFSASAQTSRPDAAPAPAATAATASDRIPGLLAGPKVVEVPGAAPALGDDQRQDARRDEVPPRRWIAVLRGLDLTAEQTRAVDGTVREMQQAQRHFERENGEALQALRREVRTARRAGERPPDETRRRMAAIMEQAPSVAAYQERLWSLLTSEQRSRMRRELARVREEIRRAREDARQERDRMTPSGDAMRDRVPVNPMVPPR